MRTDLLLTIVFKNWDLWQEIVLLGLLVVMVALLLYLVITGITRGIADGPEDQKRKAKQIERYERELQERRAVLEKEKSEVESELNESRQVIEEKKRETEEAEASAAAVKIELQKREEEMRIMLESTDMTKKELAEYQKRAKTFVAEDFIINTLTNKVLLESQLPMRDDADDCKVPKDITMDYTRDEVFKYLEKKDKAVLQDSAGKRCEVFKINGTTFAMLFPADAEGHMRMTFKCGPGYGTKLSAKYCKNAIEKAKFPYGLLWFSANNTASLEVIKQLADISYRLAALGY